MKVVLIYRSKLRGAYSIERVFGSLVDPLQAQADISEYSLATVWGSLRDVTALRRMKADVYHVTGDVHHIAPLLPWKKTVVTVNDMNHCLYDLHGARRWALKKLWFDWPLSRVRVVTAISEKTRRDLQEQCPSILGEVRVIGCPVTPRYLPRSANFDEARPRVLFVGTAPHKNLGRLSAALEGIPCRLVIVGPIEESTRDELLRAGVDFENHVRLTDEALYQQYVASDIVAFPSEREGFGLPIIEGQAVGRPVVTSDLSPMREVAGDGACLVDPFDVAAIRAGILRIVRDTAYRDGLVKRGLENARRFSAEAVAAEYLVLYEEVAERIGDPAENGRRDRV